ncbi:MAG: hypothetical protein R3C11_21555 [Planctomycetaceae bacterium]
MICEHQILSIGKPEEVLTPAHIEKAYGIEVQVLTHPEHNTPLVVPIGRPLDRD